LEHQTVTIDGVNVHYVQAGEGPVVLLLHGVGTSLVTWCRNIQPLADAGFTVIAPDLPGHGDSDKPRRLRYDPAAGAGLIGQFLTALNVDRASLVGNSAGGLVAALFSLEHPQKIDRLVLVAPGGMGRQVSGFLRLISLPFVGEVIYRPWLFRLMGLNRRLFYRPLLFPSEVSTEMDRVRALPGSARAALSSIRSSVDYRGFREEQLVLHRLPGLTVPLLTVWGENDRLIPVSQAESLRETVPQGMVRTIPQCGHWPQMEKADEFNVLVTRFLEGALDNQAGSLIQ
jgi:4,5:9,10-diseco-3-hydroxy-5,9,17-trioxoandrosta-1(10),2-diene-4-oate hydrolase